MDLHLELLPVETFTDYETAGIFIEGVGDLLIRAKQGATLDSGCLAYVIRAASCVFDL